MKTILVLAHADGGQDARLQVALDVTRALGGHLGCVDGIAVPIVPAFQVHGFGHAYGDVAIAEAMLDDYTQKAANGVRLKQRLACENVAWNWIDASGFLEDSLLVASELADLVVVSSETGFNEPVLQRLAGHLTRRLRRPILTVPQDTQGLDLSATALVAWDGSRQAQEALRAALPLLELSRQVILLAVDAPGHLAPSQAAQYLSHYGMQAQIELTQRQPGAAICGTILAKAHHFGAAYIVIGACGHSPMVETVLGGVTRSLLAKCDLPLFFAHR